MGNYKRDIDMLFEIFNNLVRQNEIRSDLKTLDDAIENEDEEIESTDSIKQAILLQHKIVREDLTKYLRLGMDRMPLKQIWILYLFFANFIFTKYNEDYAKEFTAKYPFLNEIYNKSNYAEIISVIYNNPDLLTCLIEQFEVIEYYYDKCGKEWAKNFDDIVNFYLKDCLAEVNDTIYIMVTPQIFQNTVVDIEAMYEIEEIPEKDKAESIYRYICDYPEELPTTFFPNALFLKDNIDIFNDELTLYTYIYLVCKEKQLGLSFQEKDLKYYIESYLEGQEPNYTVVADAEYMVSKYLHVISNFEKLMQNNPKEVHDAIKLARKKINSLTIECLTH